MKCHWLHIRLFAEWLAIIFFATSSVLCLSVYFYDEDPASLFEFQRTTLLTATIVHMVLCIICLLSTLYTTKLIRPYFNAKDGIYNGLIDLLGLVEEARDPEATPIDTESEEESVIVYPESVAITEISPKGIIEPETIGIDVHDESRDNVEALFSFTRNPEKNRPEKIKFKDSFMTKLSPDADLKTLILGEDPYPKIFSIVFETSTADEKKQSSTITQKIENNPLDEVWPKDPKFVFNYKSKNQDKCQETLKYHDELTVKLPASLDLEGIIFKDFEKIQEIIDAFVNKE